MGKENKNLLVTFDYELYLGSKSGSVKDCMLNPTNKMLPLLQEYDIKGIFFVDTTYLIKLKEQSANNKICLEDFDEVKSQLQRLSSEGHYIFPHIHPHWLDSIYDPESNQWSLNDVSKYRYTNNNENDRKLVFDESIDILFDILKETNDSVTLDSFRAGGWCIQPFTDFKPHFKSHNIKFDFSVQSGFYQFTDAQYFDFSDAPSANIYRFEDDVCKQDKNGSFIEIKMNHIKIPKAIGKINDIYFKLYNAISGDHTFGKGQGHASINDNSDDRPESNGFLMGSSHEERIAIELMSPIKQHLYDKFWKHSDFMHFISHPKMITNNHFKCFKKFLASTYSNYNVESDFKNMISHL